MKTLKEIHISQKTVLIVLVLFLFIVVCIFAFLPGSIKNESENESAEVNYGKLQEIIFNVKTDLVKKGDLIISVSGNGFVRANRDLDIVTNVSGFINVINVYEGKRVSKGELLIKLDDSEQKIALSEAQVNLMNAKIEYGFLSKEVTKVVESEKIDSIKKEILLLDAKFKDNEITEEKYLSRKEELDLALIFTGAKRDETMLNRSGLTNAINAVNRAKLYLSFTEIRAPFDGVIADCDLVERQRVNSGEKILKLLDISKYRIEVGIIESEIVNIAAGRNARISLASIPGIIYNGIVTKINPLVDIESKTCRITIQIPNNDKRIKAGMFANVLIETEILKDRILIPKDALLVRDRRNLVFVAESDPSKAGETLAKWHYVDIGYQNEDYIEIVNGVSAGDSIIVEGHYNLAHDAKIKVIN